MKFILFGAAGYVAPRHMEAIKEVGGELIAAMDPHDSVGIIDRYFPECRFFTQFERLDRHVQKILMGGTKIDFVTVCSPNYLHDIHCSWGLRVGAEVICEKPLVINEHNLEYLLKLQENTGNKVWVISQLRSHPKAREAKRIFSEGHHQVEVIYHVPRGDWYRHSWKGTRRQSGGLAANIGTHLFDLLLWIFGDVDDVWVNDGTRDSVFGGMLLKRAEVVFRISVASANEPQRLFKIDGENFEFSDGFESMHALNYIAILNGDGIGIEESRPRVRLASCIERKTKWTREGLRIT